MNGGSYFAAGEEHRKIATLQTRFADNNTFFSETSGPDVLLAHNDALVQLQHVLRNIMKIGHLQKTTHSVFATNLNRQSRLAYQGFHHLENILLNLLMVGPYRLGDWNRNWEILMHVTRE
jgi:hypothetical protein